MTRAPVPFDHPLWVLFSSGTTGMPKGIVHGHGGVVLEHLKALALHMDLGPEDTYLWYTSPSWMMWNSARPACWSVRRSSATTEARSTRHLTGCGRWQAASG